MLTRRAAASALGAAALLPTLGATARRGRPKPSPGPAIARLRRGIAVHNLLNWPVVEGAGAQMRFAWPPFADAYHTLPDPEIVRLKALGFDFLRITLDPAIFMATTGPRSAELSALVGERVDAILRHDLSVVLDLHPIRRHPVFEPVAMVADAKGLVADRYLATVEQMATILASRPRRRVALELMNEPQAYGPQREAWLTLQPRWAHAAWDKAPGLTLIVSGGRGGGLQGLLEFDPSPYAAGPTLFSLHYYDPMIFTHQGPSQGLGALGGVAWPAARVDLAATLASLGPNLVNAAAASRLIAYAAGTDGPATIAADFARAAAWASGHGVSPERLFLGEFGVCRTGKEGLAAPDDARAAWLLTVRTEAERLGMAWSYWGYDYPRGMGIRDSADHLDPVALKALLVRA